MFSLDEYKDVMRQIESPDSISDVQAVRARYLDSREAVQQAEEALRFASGSRGANLEPLYQRLAAAKDEALEAQREFERVSRFSGPLEAKAFADARKREQEASARKLEDAQLKANEAEKAAYKEELWPGYLQSGYTRGEFEKHFNEPVSGLWAMRVQQRKEMRDRERGQAWKDRYHSMHL